MDHASSDHAEPEGKRARPCYTVSVGEEEEYEQKRRRVDESNDWVAPGVELTEAKIIEDDLLGILEDSDDTSDVDAVIHDLDFVIKSFEEEITVPRQHTTSSVVLDETPKDASIELGYLLEASDDELGLPPSFANSADESSNNEVPESTDISSSNSFATPFDCEMPNYDNFDLGPEINNNVTEKDGSDEFVMLGGLFDFQENWDVPDFMWRPESLPAV